MGAENELGEVGIKREGFTAEQIIGKLREAEVLVGQRNTVGEVSHKLGVTEQTYYRWRREYGGMRVDQARSLKELEKDNGRLKRPRSKIFGKNSIDHSYNNRPKIHIYNI